MEILVLLFFWIGFAIAAAIVANSKGYNGVLWFFLTVILSPLAFISIVMTPKNEDVRIIRIKYQLMPMRSMVLTALPLVGHSSRLKGSFQS